MLFRFLQYINPGWYYHLRPRRAVAHFVQWEAMDETERKIIAYDPLYSDAAVSRLDAAWQGWARGIITTDSERRLHALPTPLPEDEYRFLRKYFHPVWSWYVLLLRIISGHHPIQEVRAFRKQRRVSRVPLSHPYYPHEDSWATFQSPLLARRPLVSIVLPTLNRYHYLKDILHDLEQQTYSHFEVIVVDQSEPFRPEFYADFKLNIRLIHQQEKALWKARNTAVKAAAGEYIAFSEDDVRVKPDWLANHLRCLDFFGADISCGPFFSLKGELPPEKRFFRWAEQFATGNACVKKKVFETVGLFDRQFEGQRMGDGEFGLRAHLAGFKNISNPYAACEDVKAPEGGLRQMGAWDAFRPRKWTDPRPIPSTLYYMRRYFGRKAALYFILQGVPPSLLPYRFKRNRKILALGIPLVLLLLPFVLIQVIRSWRKAGRMIKAGPRIDQL